MGGARGRVQLAAAAGGAALLLLLLLARLPPPPPRPRALVGRLQQHQTNHASQPASTAELDTMALPAAGAAASNSPPPSRAPPAPPSKQPVSNKPASNQPHQVLTKELYVGGHRVSHPELCPRLGAGLALLVLVTSAPAHSTARDAVRLTWGSFAARSDVALGFVIGQPPQKYQEAIAREDALYGDIIQGNWVDSYSNLTLKTLSMLEWCDTYCPRAPRLLKTDDDMFINIPRLLKFLAEPARANATRTIWGKVLKKAYPKRIPASKYYLSRVQWPAPALPTFATGPAYVLTRDVIRPLLLAAPSRPYLRLEDVFVTGVLADALGLKRQNAPEFYNKKISLHPCAVQRGVAIHMVRYHEQFDLWRKLLDGRTKCS